MLPLENVLIKMVRSGAILAFQPKKQKLKQKKFEPVNEISNFKFSMRDQQSLRSACAYVQSDQSLCKSLECSMTVKLLTEHHLEILSFKGGCTGSYESTLVKMPHCWKSHAMAHFIKVKQNGGFSCIFFTF